VRAKDFLQKIVKREVIAFTSTLSWDEFVWVLSKEVSVKFAMEKGGEFLIFPNLHFEAVTFEIIKKANEIYRNFWLKPRDAIHLATALHRNLSEVVTFDDDFRNIPLINYRAP